MLALHQVSGKWYYFIHTRNLCFTKEAHATSLCEDNISNSANIEKSIIKYIDQFFLQNHGRVKLLRNLY